MREPDKQTDQAHQITILGIDPGVSKGGIAIKDATGKISVQKMPKAEKDLADLVKALYAEHPNMIVVIEQVGTHMAGNAASTSVTFGRHIGSLHMAFHMLDVPVMTVRPVVWEQAVAPDRPKTGKMKKDAGESDTGFKKRRREQFDKDKKGRKLHIKELMQEKYPDIKVTEWNSDALGILTYALDYGFPLQVDNSLQEQEKVL